MYDLIKDYHGKKNLKAMDLTKAMRSKFGEDECDKKVCRAAIRELIDGGKCVYCYKGGSYIVLKPEE
jgi:hypothetical protein